MLKYKKWIIEIASNIKYITVTERQVLDIAKKRNVKVQIKSQLK